MHNEFLPEGKTLNAEFYKGVMNRLLKRIQASVQLRSALEQVNAPAHKAANVGQFLTPKNVTTLYHPPYSPNLSPPDYFLFPQFKI